MTSHVSNTAGESPSVTISSPPAGYGGLSVSVLAAACLFSLCADEGWIAGVQKGDIGTKSLSIGGAIACGFIIKRFYANIYHTTGLYCERVVSFRSLALISVVGAMAAFGVFHTLAATGSASVGVLFLMFLCALLIIVGVVEHLRLIRKKSPV